MNKYYFEKEDSEECYPIAHFINEMEKAGLSEIKIFEAVSVRDNSFIWCKRFWDAAERGSCGKSCSGYQSRNGKSGICKYQGRMYEAGKEVTIKINK